MTIDLEDFQRDIKRQEDYHKKYFEHLDSLKLCKDDEKDISIDLCKKCPFYNGIDNFVCVRWIEER